MKQNSRKSTLLALLSTTLLFSATQAWADTYEQDLNYLRSALSLSKFSDSELLNYENPFVGKTQFRLPESRAPWAGNYFPMMNGGISNRWQIQENEILDVQNKPTKEQIKQMTPEQIDKLSPAEKYDILVGDYSFSMTEHEIRNRGPLRKNPPKDWEGFCNGVRCAGILLPEPKNTIEVVNPDGIRITFQIADLKALSGASYFYVQDYAQIGSPSRNGRAENLPNPAAFDLTLRYFLAKKRKAFVVDSHLGSEIWNESIIGYQRTLSEPKNLDKNERAKYPWAVSKVRVTTVLESLSETDIADSNKTTKQSVAAGEVHKEINMAYTLYLDADGKARDGSWVKAKTLRGVDFIWFGAGRGTDSDHGNPNLNFDVIRRLFKKAVKPACQKIFSA